VKLIAGRSRIQIPTYEESILRVIDRKKANPDSRLDLNDKTKRQVGYMQEKA